MAVRHQTYPSSTYKDYIPAAGGGDSLAEGERCEQCHSDMVSGPRENLHNANITASYSDPDVVNFGWCSVCHDIHEADQSKLLPGTTISDFCFLCHDGTSANVDGDGDFNNYNPVLGYYTSNNIIYGLAATSTLNSQHRVNSNNASYTHTDATSVIPLGSGNVQDFNGSEVVLKCTSCHSPHGTASKILPVFNSKSVYLDDLAIPPTISYGQLEQNMLLRKTINGKTAEVYGSDWCLTCHDTAASGMTGIANDHPINTSTAYHWVKDLPPDSSESTYYEEVTDAGSYYYGLWMWDHSWEATSGAVSPLCMNCHDDKMEVNDIGVGTLEDFASFIYSDNFPHEGNNRRLLVEQRDDLCINCHNANTLP